MTLRMGVGDADALDYHTFANFGTMLLVEPVYYVHPVDGLVRAFVLCDVPIVNMAQEEAIHCSAETSVDNDHLKIMMN